MLDQVSKYVASKVLRKSRIVLDECPWQDRLDHWYMIGAHEMNLLQNWACRTLTSGHEYITIGLKLDKGISTKRSIKVWHSDDLLAYERRTHQRLMDLCDKFVNNRDENE